MLHELLFGILSALKRPKEEITVDPPLMRPPVIPEVLPDPPPNEPVVLFKGAYGECLSYERRHFKLMNVLGEYLLEEPRAVHFNRVYGNAVFQDAKSIHFRQAPGTYLIQDEKSVFLRRMDGEILTRDAQNSNLRDISGRYVVEEPIYFGVMGSFSSVAKIDGYHISGRLFGSSYIAGEGIGKIHVASVKQEYAQSYLGQIAIGEASGDYAIKTPDINSSGLYLTGVSVCAKEELFRIGLGSCIAQGAVDIRNDYNRSGIRLLSSEVVVSVPLFVSTV